MAVTTTSSVITYTANGTQKVFTFPYKFTRRTDIRVTLIEDGVETDLVLGAGYSVDPDGGASGTVTLTTAPAAGVTVRIRRVVGLTQEVNLPIQGPVDPIAITAALDKLTLICQQLSDGLGIYVHGKEPGGDLHALVNETTPGFMPSEDYVWMKEHQGSGASHTIEQITGLYELLEELETEILGRAPVVHGHPIEQITGLTEALLFLELLADGKAPSAHGHTWGQISDIPTTIGEIGVTDVYTKLEVDAIAGALEVDIEDLGDKIDAIQVPYIGSNGNWWTGGIDSGVRATGDDGETPYVGGNGNWWVGEEDTGVPAQGEKGDNGPAIELSTSSTHIRWRVVGTTSWTNLVTLASLKGDKGDAGPAIELQKTASHIQWRVVGDPSWTNLVSLADITGEDGDPGSFWHTGSGTPSSALGAVGDFYLDAETGDYYEKTGSSTWTPQGSLKGPKGDPGASSSVPWGFYRFDPNNIEYDLEAGSDMSPLHPKASTDGDDVIVEWTSGHWIVVGVIPGPEHEFGGPLNVILGEPEESVDRIKFWSQDEGAFKYPEYFRVLLAPKPEPLSP